MLLRWLYFRIRVLLPSMMTIDKQEILSTAQLQYLFYCNSRLSTASLSPGDSEVILREPLSSSRSNWSVWIGRIWHRVKFVWILLDHIDCLKNTSLFIFCKYLKMSNIVTCGDAATSSVDKKHTGDVRTGVSSLPWRHVGRYWLQTGLTNTL